MVSRWWSAVTRWPQLLSAVTVLALWELVAQFLRPSWLPTIQAVASSWWKLVTTGAFAVAVDSLKTLALGLAVVLVVGSVLSGILAGVRLLDEALTPLINAAMSTPVVALVPVFVLVWGYSDLTRVVAVVSFALFPLVLQWVTAFRSVPAELMEMSRSFAATRPARVRTVVIPAVAPLLLTGVRVAVVQAIKGLVTAEMIIGVVGIGKLLTTAAQTFDMAQLYAIVMTILATSIVSYLVIGYFEHRASRWADM